MNVREEFKALGRGRKRVVDAMPEVMANVSKNTSLSHADGALDAKTKHLITLGMSIMIMCDECILHHVLALYDLGTTREELCECLQTAVTLQSCPGIKYSQLALEYYDALVEEEGQVDA